MTSQRVRRPSRQDVRRRLLDAASQVLVSHGYGGASVEVITEAAGLSRGALYSNFADKDDLYLQLLDGLEQRLIDEQTAIYREHDDLDRFLGALHARAGSPTRDLRAHTILQIELWLLAMRNDEVRERLAAIQRRSVDAIAGALGGLDLGFSRHEVAATVAAISDGLTMQRLLDPDAVRDTLAVEVLRRLAGITGLVRSKEEP